MSVNLKTKAAAETFEVKLVGTDDEPMLDDEGKQASITVYGPGSKAFARASSDRAQRMVSRMKRHGKSKMSVEDQIAETSGFLAAITVSLNNCDYNGQKDPESIKAMYADTELGFIADQVQKAVGDWANFTKASTTT
jgi:hypothetical protein